MPLPGNFVCNAFLDSSGIMRKASIRREADRWTEFQIENEAWNTPPESYIVPTLPVEFHCHGMQTQDFSAFLTLDLKLANEDAEREGVFCILSVSLPYQHLDEFLSFMQEFAYLKQAGELPYIIGISLEGPLLASFGGTPRTGSWAPTKNEWEKLASCGKYGLHYIVLSPDALLPGSCLAPQVSADHPTLQWIVATLLQAGIRLASGHFQRSDPEASAACIRVLIQEAKKYAHEPLSYFLPTDHLFNDMPLNFRHAWRTPQEKQLRAQQIGELHLEQWNMDNLEIMLGHVPAELVRSASKEQTLLCMNFDGEHVDLAVCRRIVELVGAKAIIAITDSTDTSTIGGQVLHRKEGVRLWYQQNDIVAVGMSSLDQQMKNMRSIGIDEGAIWEMIALVPLRMLGIAIYDHAQKIPQYCSYVTGDGQRYAIVSHSA